MRNPVWIAILSVVGLALSGCAGDSGESTNTGSGAQTCEVKVMKNHALDSKTRTIKADLLQDGTIIGTGTFTIGPSEPETPVQVYSKTPSCRDVQIKAYEGSNPVGVKTFSPSKCPKPLEIELHVVDDAVHVYSNCD
jgi:hypothetical protein